MTIRGEQSYMSVIRVYLTYSSITHKKNRDANQLVRIPIFLWRKLPLWFCTYGCAIDFCITGILKAWNTEILRDVAIEKYLFA